MAHSYYVIASYYNKAGQIDSAWHYSNEVFKNGVDPHRSLNPSFYAFYALHAKLATLTHHLPQAVDSYQKALDSAEDYYNIQKEKRILELEKSFNIAQKNVEIANKEKQIILLILCSLLLLMIVAFLLNNLFASKRKKRKDAIMIHLVTAHTGEVAALSQALFDTLPQKKELSKLEVVNHINNCTTATRKRIIRNMVSALDDKSEQDQPYSDKEKLILLLIKNGYSTDFIAKLLNVTESNIRSSSARIKHKQK